MLLKERVNEPKLWEEEARAFLTVCWDNRAYPIYTALTSGLREGGLLALTWGDFEVLAHQDDKALTGSLHVTKSLIYVYKQVLALAHANLSHLHNRCLLGAPKTQSKSSVGYVTIPGYGQGTP